MVLGSYGAHLRQSCTFLDGLGSGLESLGTPPDRSKYRSGRDKRCGTTKPLKLSMCPSHNQVNVEAACARTGKMSRQFCRTRQFYTILYIVEAVWSIVTRTGAAGNVLGGRGKGRATILDSRLPPNTRVQLPRSKDPGPHSKASSPSTL